MRRNWRTILCLVLLVGIINHSSAEEAKQITCTGKVVDGQGRPIDDAKVALHEMVYGQTASSYDTKLIGKVTTRADGAFSFSTNAESEVYRYGYIIAEKEGLALGFANWRMREGDKELEIQLGLPQELSGLVVDENDKPLSGAQVSISMLVIGTMRDERGVSGPVAAELFTSTTDAEGKFKFTKIPPKATAEFIMKKDGRATVGTFKSTGTADQKLNFAAGQADIKLVLPVEAKIEGIVVEKNTGKPISGIKVMAKQDMNRPLFGQEPIISKKDGTFGINALVGGRHILQIESSRQKLADWIAESVEVMAEAGKTVSDVKIELSKGGILEVVVTDAVNKKPVEKVSIGVRNQASSQYHGSRTDKDGIARIRLVPGEYQMSNVYKEGYSRQRIQDAVTIEEGKTERIEYELAGMPKVTGVVRDEKGKPLEGVKLKVCPAGRQDSISQADGTFEADYDPGNWPNESPGFILVCRYEEGNLAVAVPIDEDIRKLEVTLKPAVILTGKVLDPDGKGIANARINTMIRGPRWGSTIGSREPTMTDKEGKFEIRAIPADNKYNINTTAEGYGENRSEEINTEDAVNNHLDVGTITLAVANLSVSGMVVDDDDKPVAGVRVSCYSDNQPRRNTQTDTEGKFTLEKVCAGKIRISANKSGTPRLYGSIETEGGATDVSIVISQRSSSTRYQPKRPRSLVGRPLPELKDLKINISPADVSDKMILVCFWDMEQRPSRNCIMRLAKQAQQLKQKGVTVVAVQASKIDGNALNQWVKKYNIPFTVGMIQGDVEKSRFAWGVRSLPWLILTDKQHTVQMQGFSINELNERIATLKEK
ncbi:MAG: carboxypeptidase regulatory-like domain-containing protein [Planctomycetes bacterium]|nr:carboxypeptidase regulatory-like domain-containing protein [Planctomycetota bacterium]